MKAKQLDAGLLAASRTVILTPIASASNYIVNDDLASLAAAATPAAERNRRQRSALCPAGRRDLGAAALRQRRGVGLGRARSGDRRRPGRARPRRYRRSVADAAEFPADPAARPAVRAGPRLGR